MLDQLHWFWSYFRRCRREPSDIRSFIESEGGIVIATRQLGAVRPSPFEGLRPYPILWEARVRYGNHLGRWLVRTSRGSGCFDWVWCDEYGENDLPVERPGAIVDNEVTPIGYAFEATIVFGVVLIGVGGILALCWFVL